MTLVCETDQAWRCSEPRLTRSLSVLYRSLPLPKGARSRQMRADSNRICASRGLTRRLWRLMIAAGKCVTCLAHLLRSIGLLSSCSAVTRERAHSSGLFGRPPLEVRVRRGGGGGSIVRLDCSPRFELTSRKHWPKTPDTLHTESGGLWMNNWRAMVAAWQE